jgi:hypothetical protein
MYQRVGRIKRVPYSALAEMELRDLGLLVLVLAHP